MKIETLSDRHEWLRIADRDWKDPLDPLFAARRGGRWNSRGGHLTLYLNEDVTTARVNLMTFVADWPYEPEDLRNDTGPILVSARLPRRQLVADAHSAEGLAELGLPPSYPVDKGGSPIGHDLCQPIGDRVHAKGLRGVLCRSANSLHGAGRELAWFPATARSRATVVSILPFTVWFWGDSTG